MKLAKVKLVPGRNLYDWQVLVDGHDISEYTRGISVYIDAGRIPEIDIHLNGTLELSSEVQAILEMYRWPDEEYDSKEKRIEVLNQEYVTYAEADVVESEQQ